MSGRSRKTQVVALRLPNNVMDILNRRINGRRTHWESIGAYLQDRIIYDTLRKHYTSKNGRLKDVAQDNMTFDKNDGSE